MTSKSPEREAKVLRLELTRLTAFVQSYLTLLDQAMKQPDGQARGSRIADLSNKLEFKNDSVRRFVLDIDQNGRAIKRAQRRVTTRAIGSER
jgi:hypothetical protein